MILAVILAASMAVILNVILAASVAMILAVILAASMAVILNVILATSMAVIMAMILAVIMTVVVAAIMAVIMTVVEAVIMAVRHVEVHVMAMACFLHSLGHARKFRGPGSGRSLRTSDCTWAGRSLRGMEVGFRRAWSLWGPESFGTIGSRRGIHFPRLSARSLWCMDLPGSLWCLWGRGARLGVDSSDSDSCDSERFHFLFYYNLKATSLRG